MKKLWLTTLLLFTLTASFTLAQENPSAEQKVKKTIPIAVDGSETPDLVPDELAYRHFLMAIALSEDPSPSERERRSNILGRVGLSEEDFHSVILAMDGVRNDLDFFEEQIKELTKQASSSEIEALYLQRDTILDSARDRIHSQISADGSNRLETHIRDVVKKRIKIYGEVKGSKQP